MQEKKTEKLTPQQALLKAANYCAYQERCHEEVREKLGEWGIYGNDREEIILQLIQQNYLNEERFAKAFAGGKFRTKHWGRIKITLELKARNVTDYCINKAMKEIPGDEYSKVLNELAEEKFRSEKDRNVLVKRNKTAQFLIGKGFEPEMVWDVLRNFA
ncbi:MAG: regulatory protein RecX [Bacteroidia bacterium]